MYDEKVAQIAGTMAANPRKKTTEKDAMIEAVRKQKAQFKKALKNGYTRKEIVAQLREQGIAITSRDLSEILGKKPKPKKQAIAS